MVSYCFLLMKVSRAVFCRISSTSTRGTGSGRLIESGDFDPGDAVSYFPQDAEAGFILLCTAELRSNLRIRTHMQEMMRAHRSKRICRLRIPEVGEDSPRANRAPTDSLAGPDP
jgi:hypothetical protein